MKESNQERVRQNIIEITVGDPNKNGKNIIEDARKHAVNASE